MMRRIPAHGCARCIWWAHKLRTENGRCHLHKESRFYQCMPCDEYELDPMAPESIEVGDEVHDVD